MVTCQIGHSLFKIPKKISRIRQQDYLQDQWQNLYNDNNFPIDAIISPEQEIAKSLVSFPKTDPVNLKLPTSLKDFCFLVHTTPVS